MEEIQTEMERQDSRDYYVPEKSTFVTVIGVIFCVLAVLSMLAIAGQLAFSSFITPPDSVQEQMNENQVLSFINTYKSIFITISLAIAIAQLVSSIGLLQRKNWARISFIVILSILIVRSFFSYSLQFFMPTNIPEQSQSSAQMVQNMTMIIRIVSFIIVALFAILYGWIIMKLSSEKIRREFDPKLQGEDY